MQRKVTYESAGKLMRSAARRTRKRGKKYNSRHDEHKQKSSQKRDRRFDRNYKEQGRNFYDHVALREEQVLAQYQETNRTHDELMGKIDNRYNHQTSSDNQAWENHINLLSSLNKIMTPSFDDMLLKKKRQVQNVGCLVCLECNYCIPLDKEWDCLCADALDEEWLWVKPNNENVNHQEHAIGKPSYAANEK